MFKFHINFYSNVLFIAYKQLFYLKRINKCCSFTKQNQSKTKSLLWEMGELLLVAGVTRVPCQQYINYKGQSFKKKLKVNGVTHI